jgi:hypothetical protein
MEKMVVVEMEEMEEMVVVEMEEMEEMVVVAIRLVMDYLPFPKLPLMSEI